MSNGYHPLLYKLCEPPHLGSDPLGFPTSHDQSPSKTALYLHQGHSSIIALFDLVKVDLFNLLHPFSHPSVFKPALICLFKLILVHIELFALMIHSSPWMVLTWSNLTLSTSNCPCSHMMVSNIATRMIPFHTKRVFMPIKVKYGSLPLFIHLLGAKIKNQYSY